MKARAFRPVRATRAGRIIRPVLSLRSAGVLREIPIWSLRRLWPRRELGTRSPPGKMAGPGYHPDRLPWPSISPFENRYAETTHEDDLWFFRANNSPRQYFANVDLRRANYRRPDQTRVGNEIARQRFIIGEPPFLPVDTGVL